MSDDPNSRPGADQATLGTVGLEPVYCRGRGPERARIRLAVALLAVLCALLACRPGGPPRTEPGPTRDARAEMPPDHLPQPLEPVPAAPTPQPEKPSAAPAAPGVGEGQGWVAVAPIVQHSILPPPVPRRARRAGLDGPLLLRVGLATDLDRFSPPCCDPRIGAWVDGAPLVLDSPIVVKPAESVTETAVYRLQVAALKDEKQAQGIADYLGSSTEYPTEASFDADTDLYRVRVGRFADRAQADAARGRLATLGIEEGWVVREGGHLRDPALEVVQGQRRYRVEGRWLEIRPVAVDESAPFGLPFGAARYRGALLVFLNERGLLNVINELELEEYLRGVVPKEMGPELYDEIEAIKAQTVAARTYTLRNLDEFAHEGYDICSTPRCQVYGGMGVEHPTSDRAIEQTRGQVLLYEGEPAQAYYSATCGGHTENVEVIFPQVRGDYLRGVPCLESGVTPVRGDRARQSEWPGGLMADILPSASGNAVARLAERLEHLARSAGLAAPSDRLRATTRSEIVRTVRSLFDLVLDRQLTRSDERLAELLASPPESWQERERRLASFLHFGRWLDPQAPAQPDESQIESLLLELSLYLGVLREERGHFLSLSDGVVRMRQRDRHVTYRMPSHFATFRRRGTSVVESSLDLMAGDRLRLYLHRDQVVSLVQPLDSPPVRFGKRAPKQSWTLFKTDGQLRRAVQKRYPGFPFVDFEVLERGVSGRVGRMALIGEGGERIEVEGLAVRWTLDVWDTQFRAERTVSASGKPGWLFRGRGWGHGVGMSQAGAFGMAVRGLTYREILQHYYTGVRLGRLEPAAPERRPPTLPAG